MGFYSEEVAKSSETDLWATPQDFFDKLDAEFGFELDVCATPENAKCPDFFTEEDNGLAQRWYGVCWMNPPYGDSESVCTDKCTKKKCITRGHHNQAYTPGIKDWMKKAHDSAAGGALVVCLVPARTDTSWWHEYAIKHEVRFIRGRLKFGAAKDSAPFPSAVVVMRKK